MEDPIEKKVQRREEIGGKGEKFSNILGLFPTAVNLICVCVRVSARECVCRCVSVCAQCAYEERVAAVRC